MKPPQYFRFPSRSGFTLVELLVVMGIIGILAAVLLSAGGAAIKSAQRAKASQLANSIQTAALNYYTEYSVYPVPPGTTTDYSLADTDTTGWTTLVEALCGNINPANGSAVTPTIANTRGIAFLSLKSSDLFSGTAAPANPLPPSSANPTLNIMMDGDYDGILGQGSSTTASPGPSALPNFAAGTSTTLSQTGGSSTAGVAVWINCSGKAATATPMNSAFWVHTY